MEIAAEPHPSGPWATKGTSSQMPVGVLAEDGCCVTPKMGGAARTKNANWRIRVRVFTIFVPQPRIESAQRQGNDQDGDNDEDDPQQVAVGDSARCEITLRLTRTLGKPGEIFVAQLADGPIHLLKIYSGGLQSFLAGIRGEQGADGLLVGMTCFRRPGGIALQFTRGNDVLWLCVGFHAIGLPPGDSTRQERKSRND